MSPKLTRIVIAGVGTVGTGVLNLLKKNKILEKFNLGCQKSLKHHH